MNEFSLIDELDETENQFILFASELSFLEGWPLESGNTHKVKGFLFAIAS